MKSNAIRLSATAVLSALACGLACAQGVEQVNVQTQRSVTRNVVGRTSSGLPVADITVSYAVITRGLDLRSSAGAAELATRIRDAARGACQDIARQYPSAAPSDAECAKVAADQAMVRAHQLVREAQADAVAR
jgi:UrcA family protein